MKKNFKFISVGVCAFLLGVGINNVALSDIANTKIAVVDVQKVVASSAQVKALKSEQQQKVRKLQTFVEEAKKSVAGTNDAAKKKALEDKYNKELRSKTAALEADYAKRLKDIDKSISNTISAQAKAKNYNIVLAKGVVLYGGDDITADIIKNAK